MKELSIEEKAKAYDKAIKVIKDNLDALNEITETGTEVVNIQPIKNCFYRAFPELKESEDEKIRACIEMCLTDIDEQRFADFSTNIKECLDWLKKQGEQAKFRDSIQVGDTVTRNKDGILVNLSQLKRVAKKDEKQGEHKSADKEYTFKAIPRLLGMIPPTDRAKSYCQKLIDSLEQEGYSTDAKIVRDCLKQMNGEKVAMATMDEQKPTWSEEDKLKSSILIHVVKKQQGSAIFEGLLPEELIEWLEKKGEHKSAWKPSVEQMIILRHVISGCSYDIEPLVEMEEQLKKLM